MKEGRRYLRIVYSVSFFFPLLFLLPSSPSNLNLSFCGRHQSSNYTKQAITAMYGNSVINLSDHSEDQISVPFFSNVHVESYSP